MVRKFEGVEVNEEVSGLRLREDLRSLPQKLRDWWLTPDGQSNTFLAIFGLALLLVWAPLGGEFALVLTFIFSKILLGYKKKKWDFPFRVPIIAGLTDGSTNAKGKGLMFLGNDVKTRMPAFISDNDARTHALLFGTTGSGKTELLLAFVVNSLVYDGGASYTDGKGDVKLWLKFVNAARMLGREDDLLMISFITSGHEFYDRQETKISNTMNPYATGSSGMCTEASIALMDSSGGGGDMWKGRAIAFLGALIKPLVFLRDKGDVLLDADLIREYFDLPVLEKFVWDEDDIWKGGIKREAGYFRKTYGRVWNKVIRPLEAFMATVPGYDKSRIGKQEQKTLEQHGYITMQLARLFGEMGDNYGHIMQTPLGEVDMFDVVINDRILVTLLPALEKSPESLGMLGKIIVGGIKQMAAGCLGNQVEGLRREIVDARPTNSPVPFPTIFDEYGYYAVLGFSSMPAQARSLGFMVIFAAQDFASLKKSSAEEADQTWENTNLRGMGRITSGGDAETYKRIEALGGRVKVAEVSGFERVFGMFGTKLRASENIQIVEKPRVSSDDLHSQANGEFHLFMGKMEKDASVGRVKVVRVNSFFTDIEPIGGDPRTQPSIRILELNHFARVTPPAIIIDHRSDMGLFGENGFRKLLLEDKVNTRVAANQAKTPLSNTVHALFTAHAGLDGEKQFGSLDFAFAALRHAVECKRLQNAQIQEHLTFTGPFAKPDLGLQTDTLNESGTGKGGTSGGVVSVNSPVTVTSVVPKKEPVSVVVKTKTIPPVNTKAVVTLTEEDKATLTSISLFTDGAVSIPINNATEEDLVGLAQDMLAAGQAVFGHSPEAAAELAMTERQLQLQVKGMDVEEMTDMVMAAEPKPLAPEDSHEARAKGRAFMNEMALGSSYLEGPVPRDHGNTATFMDAVEALHDAVVKNNG